MLLAGPYEPPRCVVGSTVEDLRLGDVIVVGKRDGWPLCLEPPRPGPNPLGEIPVLTGDLVRAVCEESIEAVAQHWNVPPTSRPPVAEGNHREDAKASTRRWPCCGMIPSSGRSGIERIISLSALREKGL